MRDDLRDVTHAGQWMRSRRGLLWSALLAVLVVAAAGISGTTHFGGPRWLPDWKIAQHSRAPGKLPSRPRTKPPPTQMRHGGGSFPIGVVIWVVIGLAAVAVALLLWRWWLGRPSRGTTSRSSVAAAAMSETPVEPEPEPDTLGLRTGIALALHVLDEGREPADAIVRAWLGLQEAAEESGITRRPAETPTEFTSRILSRAFADDAAVRTLLRLYLRARFGDQPVSANDVAAARAALQQLSLTWPAPKSPVQAKTPVT